jgi:hypothetical protein
MDSLVEGVNEKVAPIIAGLERAPQGAGREKSRKTLGESVGGDIQRLNGSVPRTVYSWTEDWRRICRASESLAVASV